MFEAGKERLFMKIPQAMIDELQYRHEGRPLKQIKESGRIVEVVCELGSDHAGSWSTALAIIGESAPHFHRKMKEVYLVARGTLDVHLKTTSSEFIIRLHEGDHYVIVPFTVHFAEGIDEPAEVLVIATPAWSPEDHVLVEKS